MSYRKHKSLQAEATHAISDRVRLGRSKYADKHSPEGDVSSKYIYSYSTARAYGRISRDFAEYAQSLGATSLEEARPYAHDYIQARLDQGLSAYTLKLERSALAKLYECAGADIYEGLPSRRRADITRSRGKYTVSEKTGKVIKSQSTRAGQYSEARHPELTAFMQSTGLRRCELSTLTGDQLRVEGRDLYIDIRAGQAKGGRTRSVPVLPEGRRAVLEACMRAGDGLVWEKLPSHLDVHYYRAEYATALYKSLARPVEDLSLREKYFCRGDLKGVVYDRSAMLEVSEALGHSRVSVVAEHYLRAADI